MIVKLDRLKTVLEFTYKSRYLPDNRFFNSSQKLIKLYTVI